MKISDALKHFSQGHLKDIEIRRNPSNRYQWYVTLRKTNGKTFFLTNEDDQTLVEESLERLFNILKQIGFKDAHIVF